MRILYIKKDQGLYLLSLVFKKIIDRGAKKDHEKYPLAEIRADEVEITYMRDAPFIDYIFVRAKIHGDFSGKNDLILYVDKIVEGDEEE